MTETEINAITTDISWIKSFLEKQAEFLERIEKQLDEGKEKCRGRHEKIDRELGELTVRASLIGTVAGLVGGGVIGMMELLFRVVLHGGR